MVGKNWLGMVMVLATLLMIGSISAVAETQDVSVYVDYTIESNNETGTVNFYYQNGTLIKTASFDVGSTTSSSFLVETNVSFGYSNTSGGDVYCGDMTLNLPSIVCEPQYTFNEAECPGLECPVCPECTMTCPEQDNTALQDCLASVDKKLNPESPDKEFYEETWFFLLLFIGIIVGVYFYINREGTTDTTKKPKRPRNEDPPEPTGEYGDGELRKQSIPVSRSDPQPNQYYPQPAQPVPVQQPVAQQPAVAQPLPVAAPARIERPQAINDLDADLDEVARKKDLRAQLSQEEQSPEQLKKQRTEDKLNQLRKLRE